MNLRTHIANILTLTNFTLGVVSILISASSGIGSIPYLWSALLIIITAFTDRFDGKMARKLNTVSELGKELDSLSDLVSFGVAPAILTWRLYNLTANEGGTLPTIILYLVVLFFPMAGALRLAKFNIQDDRSYFVGIPITLAGGMTALINLLLMVFIGHGQPCSLAVSMLTIIVTAILGVLMISKFKLQKR